jgi:hypothetical protein
MRLGPLGETLVMPATRKVETMREHKAAATGAGIL